MTTKSQEGGIQAQEVLVMQVRSKYRAYTLKTFRQIPQIKKLTLEQRYAIEVVGNVLPFRVNNYVVNELISWDHISNDPIFRLTFPQQEMLLPHHFKQMADGLRHNADPRAVRAVADHIRMQLNPHPAGQLKHNVPTLNGQKLSGVQHKYRETVLFFPSQGQTCHAYCTFCFRWPQFVGMKDLRFAGSETESLVAYLRAHPQVTDVLFTGGDPMVMRASVLRTYVEPLLSARLPQIRSLRIGTKSLSYWPYRYLTDPDADDVLRLFEQIQDSGKHLAIMAHFNHPNELSTVAVQDAVRRIRNTGAQIRTQSPILEHINADAHTWAMMWQKQVSMGMVPYYMFIVRDTGAQHYFGVPLVQAWKIYRDAYSRVGGLARTVRGPSASAKPGKIQILGVSQVKGKRVIVLRFIQGRNPDWVHRPFFAEYDAEAIWPDELRPAFGHESFFFNQENDNLLAAAQ
jgi:L-lysine 2,3-aminomutase